MATEAITSHHARLKERGIDLGAAQGSEQDAGHSGRVQSYASGSIYWHATTGAHALRGRLLQRYAMGGGPGPNPTTGERELGFPTSDETRTADGLHRCATFEWGTVIDVPGTPLVRLFGRLYEHWRAEGGELGRLGYPLTDVHRIAAGRAAWFERGVLWHREGSTEVLVGELIPPLLGRPMLVAPAFTGFFEWMRFDGAVAALDADPSIATALMDDRVLLVPVGGGVMVTDGFKVDATPDTPPEPASTPAKPAVIPLFPTVNLRRSDNYRLLDFVLPGRPRRRLPFRVPVEVTTAASGTAPSNLEPRQLYSLALRSPDGPVRTLSPHCLYARPDWNSFGIAHITDLHVSRRIDFYRAKLRSTGVAEEDVARFNNWNDAFRVFIRYANHLHATGRLDIVLATGDLVDYVREIDDDPHGPGNFGFLQALIEGRAPGRDQDSPASEPLRVPIFTSLGNHDYRGLPYPLGWELSARAEDTISHVPFIGPLLQRVRSEVDGALRHVPGLGLLTQTDIVDLVTRLADVQWQHQGLNTTHQEALQLMGLKPEDDNGEYCAPRVLPEAAAPAITVEPAMKAKTHYYFRRICRENSYEIRLGKHRVVMLDTLWDRGISTDVTPFVLSRLGVKSESERNFAHGNPDSDGVVAGDLDLLRSTLQQAQPDAIVIVGMHAPPLNPQDNEIANCLRESVHPTTPPEQVVGWLVRRTPSEFVPPIVHEIRPGWPRTGTAYCHLGAIDDLLDYGIAVGQKERLPEVFVGRDAARPVTIVLSGHGHYRFEYRLRWNSEAGNLETYLDHYLGNPATYYPMRRVVGKWSNRDDHRRSLVRITAGAPVDGELGESPFEGTIWAGTEELHVAPYPTPLNSVADRAAWWRAHAPVVVQTGALGPCTNTRATLHVNEKAPGPNFQGFRLLEVTNNVIARAQYVLMDDVRGASFPLAWER